MKVTTSNPYKLLNDPRFSIAFLMITCVGIGSTFFHATLRRYAQCLDELPMLWTAYLLLYNSLDYKMRVENVNTIIVPIFEPSSSFYTISVPTLKLTLLSICISLTGIYFYLPHLYVVFFLGYSLGVVSFASLMYYHIIYCAGHTTHQHFSKLPPKLFWYAFFGYFGGFTLWVIENTFCQYLPPWLYLHSIWHISAGIGTYYTVQCQLAWRAEEHNIQVRLKSTPIGLDYVAASIKV
jgi:dihydroceramidase